jgi:hypothetical protein
MECCNNLKIVSLRLAHSLRSKTLSVVILTGLLGGLVVKPKLLMRFLAIEETSTPSPMLEESSRSSRKLAASMQRL